MSEHWWICTRPTWQGGERILGPFESRELALDVRQYVEAVRKPATFWVDRDDALVQAVP